MSLTETVLSQMPGDPLSQLHRVDRFWQIYREGTQPIPAVVDLSAVYLGGTDFDVAICGGTLGIFIGCALQARGWRVALLEQGVLRGRDQEWNISRQELDAFVELDLLTPDELERAIATEYNPGRVSFLDGVELWVRDVLNIGVDPVFLLSALKQKFLACGGKLLENTGFRAAIVRPDGIEIEVGGDRPRIKARLLLDAMGHFSPIARQARQGAKPDGVCVVVGSCAKGIPQKEFGDLIVTFAPIQKQCQYFWEAFPAREGRTTYLFTYIDTHKERSDFTELFEDYLSWLPQYQDVDLAEIQFQRALFGFFPSYKQSPLQTAWHRILQVGDSSSSQSPLSFGGFGSLVRHLVRLTEGISEALAGDLLRREDLRLLHPYQPNLSVTWLFQKAMSVEIGRKVEANSINHMLSTVFQSMQKLGDPVLKPFLQDVVQFPALSQTMLSMALADPILVAQVIRQVGLASLVDWTRHYVNLGSYSLLYEVGKAFQPFYTNLLPEHQYYWHRWLDRCQYGSGRD